MPTVLVTDSELIVSSLAVAITIASTHFAYLLLLAWVPG